MPIITPGATTVGAVQISGLAPQATPIESWLNGMLTGKAYGTSMGQAAVASVHSYVELRNPAGSGRNLWVYSVVWNTNIADNPQMYVNIPPALTGGFHGANLQSAALTSLGMVAGGTVGSLPANNIWGMTTTPNVNGFFPYPWTILLPPNSGFAIYTFNVNCNMNANYMWLEV